MALPMTKPFTARELIVASLLTLAGLYGIAGLVRYAAAEQSVPPPVSPDEQYAIDTAKQAEADVRDLMKDPDATKFKGLVANGKAQCVSGQVMGKNSYGAYEGYKAFVWNHGKITIASDDPDSAMDAASASIACVSAMGKFGGNKLTGDV